MSINNLIKSFVTDLKPVKVFKYGAKDYCLILLIGLFSILISLAIAGIRNDINDIIFTKRFIFEILILISLAMISSISALQMSIPNIKTHYFKKIIFINLVVWLISIIYFFINSEFVLAGWGFNCAQEIILTSVIPSFSIYFILKKASTLNRSVVGWLILTAGASYGALAAYFSCASNNPLHILIWHSLPVLIAGFIGFIAGNFILKKV